MNTPADAPLLDINDVADYVRRTPEAVRQTMKRASNGQPDELGAVLLELRVKVGARRVMFNRKGLVEWLRLKAEQAAGA